MNRRDVRVFVAGFALALAGTLAVAWQDARHDRVMIRDLVDSYQACRDQLSNK